MGRTNSKAFEFSAQKQALLKSLLAEAGIEPLAVSQIARRPEDSGAIPLSFVQQRMWFLEQLHPNTSLHNVPGVFRLTGALDVETLQASLREILRRHEVLRMTFQARSGQPVACISPMLDEVLSVDNLQAVLVAEREVIALSKAKAEARHPFNLTTGPLIRTTLYQLAPQEHLLVLVMHHMVADGWSLGLFVQELGLLYDAFSREQRSPLPELPIQYADFAHWQQQSLIGEGLDTQLSYWRQQLSGELPTLLLPTDRPRVADPSFSSQCQSFQLSPSLSHAIKTLAHSEDATVFMTLLTAFKILLYRYTGQEDILVGAFNANRNRAEIENLLGVFVNTVVLRTSVMGNLSFRALLQQVREKVLAADSHQDLPFEKLVEALQPERQLTQSPLFQVVFAHQNIQLESRDIAGVTLTPVPIDNGTAQFDLMVHVAEADHEINGWVTYRTELFDATTIQRLMGHFQVLLDKIVVAPEQAIATLPLLTIPERQQIVEDWNHTQTPVPSDDLSVLFEAQVRRSPETIAVVFEQEALTYQQLNQRANQLARYLQTFGVGRDDLVGICVERSLDMVVGLLAILKVGGAYVPIDPTYPQERLAWMLADSQLSILLTQEHLVSRLPRHHARMIDLDRDRATFATYDSDNLDVEVTAENLAYVIYTSGSTGKPKGVQIPRGAVVNFLLSMQRSPGLTANDVLLAVTTISFDIAVLELFLPLMTGAKLVLASRDMASDGQKLSHCLTTSGATVMQATPATWQMVLAAGWSGNPTLKILCGGEALGKGLAAALSDKGASVWNLYGPTETTIWSAVQQVQSAPLNQASVSIGHPIANTQIYLLDANQQAVPIGVPGELHIGGAGLARGYLNRPDLTEEKFILHPLLHLTEVAENGSGLLGDRLYKTGDLARYLGDGTIEYLGRLDHQVKIRGFRIELGEIETALGAHSKVQQAVVVAREKNAQNQQLVAYMIPEIAQDEVPAEQIQKFLSQKLPAHMVPNVFIWLETFPLTPNGKIDRRSLPMPKLTSVNTSQTAQFIPPSTSEEILLAGIWVDLLGIEQVSIYDNFFALGGHSLLATQVIARLREELEIELPVRELFENPTIATLGQRLKDASEENVSDPWPPLVPISCQDRLPISSPQRRLWFLDQLEDQAATYNIPAMVRLKGKLNVEALSQALNEIASRHEILRTTFVAVDGQPIPKIASASNFALDCIDLSTVPETLNVRAKTVAQQPFNLEQGPLFRATLFQLGSTNHVLLLTMHHIIADGWSMGILVEELAAYYASLANYQPVSLPAPSIQYIDVAHWQQQCQKTSLFEQQFSYWQQQLANIPAELALPTDRPRPISQTFNGATAVFVLSPEVSLGLQQLSQKVDVTLFMTLLAAFQVLLYRYTQQEDICIGTPIANRTRRETERLIGCFANTLVVRTSLARNPSFLEFLGRVRQVALDAYAHQDVPFERLVEVLQPQRSLSHSPLFQVMFILQNAPLTALELPDLSIAPLAIERTTAKFDLTLTMQETAQGLTGEWEYNIDLFDAATIDRFTQHFQTLLAAIIETPGEPIATLPVLTASEREQLLVTWNDTQADYPQELCLHGCIEAQVERTPEAIALVFDGQSLTYRDLNQRANQLANALQRLGVGPDVLVGLCVRRSPAMVIGLLAILKAGGAYLPLDPDYPAERLAFVLEDARPSVLLTEQSFLAHLLEQTTQILFLDAKWTQEPTTNLGSEVNATNLAYVIYTSGSTGQPKGVQIAHGSLLNFLHSLRLKPGITADDRWLSVTTLSFDIAALELFLPLMVGASVVIVSRDETRDGRALAAKLSTSKATIMQATPSTWQLLFSAGWSGNPRLKVLSGGEPLPSSLASKLLANCGSVWNLYGPTETTIWSTIELLEDSDRILIGRPIANTQVYVLDRALQPVPIGVTGELYISGDGLAKGYLNCPELTAERFIPHPFRASGSLYKTGDLARYLPNGKLECLGRCDRQVKLRGFRIELGEIEAALIQLPEVREAAVIVREDEPDLRYLAAYLVLASETNFSTQDWMMALGQKLPTQMIPATFVILEALPLTPNGKVDRRSLPAPDRARSDVTGALVEPRTIVEQQLVAIWKQVLRLEAVSIQDNFFELGGHSLLATQLLSRIRHTFQVELTLRSFFETPTIAGLAARIEAQTPSPDLLKVPPLVPVSRNRELPLSFAQQRLWFLEQVETATATYNMAAAVRLTGNLNVLALEQSLNEVIERHESLRTNFVAHEGTPQQIIHSEMTLPLPLIEVGELPPCPATSTAEPQARCELQIQAYLHEQAQQPFDLTQGPLLRATLVRINETEQVMLFAIHHLVADGWSIGVLIKEIATLYENFSADKPSPLPDLTIQYADFALWQRQWLQGEILANQLTYWQQKLSGQLPTLKLPTACPPETIKTQRGASQSFTIPTPLADQLYALARQADVTLFMVLLAAFQILLYRYTDEEDMIVGTDVANRNRVETEALIGFFVNLLVLRTDLSGQPTFLDLLQRVRQVTLEAYEHQDIPFEKVVGAIAPQRGLTTSPLFQVLFVLQNAPVPTLELPGLTITPVALENERARFDLALLMTETPEGIVGDWQYNADLFETATIEKMSANLNALLHSIVQQPDTRINYLEMQTEHEKQQRTQQKKQRKQTKISKFAKVKPKTISLSIDDLVETSYFDSVGKFPLIISPKIDDLDRVSWAKNYREFLETSLLTHGAILFRNFGLDSAAQFEQFAEAICPQLFGEYGDLPREGVAGKVYGSTPYPADQAILFHNESSHMNCWPQKIWFFCLQPSQTGGETPIVDCRKVLQKLTPELRRTFEQKQLNYVRNYTQKLDVSWQDFFHTSDRSVVENYCAQANIDVEWLPDGNLRTGQVRPAIINHPKTGESVFFNQIQLHHLSYLPPAVQDSLLQSFGEASLPRHIYYGDRTPIEEEVVTQIFEIYQEAAVSFSWQKGDVLMLDNMLAAHGRNSYTGSRKIVVAMGEMIDSSELK